MPIRNLARRLRDNDWLAFAIEVVIVVVGVFIGLQVNNWNQDRQDALRGREYLQRLRADFVEEVAATGRVVAFWGQTAHYADAALANAQSGTLVDDSAWKTLLAYYQASQVWPLRQPGSTFDEIRSSGELRLIADPGLRDAISRHYDRASGSQSVEVLNTLPAYREHVRGIVPWPVQQYIWANCFWTDGVNQRLIDCTAPVGEDEAKELVDRLRQQEGLIRELRFWRANLEAGAVVIGEIQKHTAALQQDIDGELAKR
jgi:hypothetical protein